MRIAIDARWIFPQISGIGNYTRQFTGQLAKLDRNNSYLLLFKDAAVRDRTVAEIDLRSAPNFETRLLPYGVFSPLNQLLLPLFLRREACDIYHSTNYMIPLMAFPAWHKGRIRCVVTIHDVIPLLFPKAAPRSRKARMFALYRLLMQQVVARADAIVTDSMASRNDILKTLGIPAERASMVRAVYCGVSDIFTPGPMPVDVSPDRPARLLYVGRSDPYKNVTGLIRIVDKARRTCRSPIQLIIAGAQDPRYPEAEALSASLGLGSIVRWTGYLSDGELAETYRGSDLLVHPSRYEGFGLQVAEAMSSGLPVLCSNAASLPEVAGDAAVLLDPDNEDDFAAAIRDILASRQRREAMRARGLAQARRFTWASTAREILAIYEETGKGA